LLWNPHFINFL